MERSDVGTTNAHPPQLKHPRALDIVGNYGFVDFFSTTTTTNDFLRSADLEVNWSARAGRWQRVGDGIVTREGE